MKKIFLKIIICALVLSITSCKSKKDDPLTIPPNFSEVPDPNKPEQPTTKQKDADVSRLKDLLLKSD